MSTYSTRLAQYRPFHYWGRPEQDSPVVMQKKDTKAKPSSGQDIKDKVLVLESGHNWLKWSHRNLMTLATIVLSVMGIGFAIMGVCFAVIFFTIRDTKQDIKEIRTLLLELIQKQTPPPAPASDRQAGTSPR